MIAFGPTEEQELIRRTLADFAERELRPRAREHEKAGGVGDGLRRALHSLGAGLIEIPEVMGGQGLGAVTAALAREALASGDVAAAIELDGPGAAALALCELGTAEQARRWLAPFAADAGAGHRGALALSEAAPPPAGRLQGTRAVREGGDYLISGEKAFVVGAPEADLLVVLAELDDPADAGPPVVAPFVVAGPAFESGSGERRPPGLTLGPRVRLLGLEAVQVASLRFDRVRVPASARLGEEGGGRADLALARLFGRLWLAQAARAVGLASASTSAALAYAQERTAFGRPVAHFQAIAFLLADLHTELDAARLMTWRAAALWDAAPAAGPLDDRQRALLSAAAMAGAQASRAAEWITERGVQILGGAGYLQDHLQEKWMRDAKTLALLGPTRDDAHRLIGALELGAAVQEVQWEPELPLPGSELPPCLT